MKEMGEMEPTGEKYKEYTGKEELEFTNTGR